VDPEPTVAAPRASPVARPRPVPAPYEQPRFNYSKDYSRARPNSPSVNRESTAAASRVTPVISPAHTPAPYEPLTGHLASPGAALEEPPAAVVDGWHIGRGGADDQMAFRVTPPTRAANWQLIHSVCVQRVVRAGVSRVGASRVRVERLGCHGMGAEGSRAWLGGPSARDSA